jgi:hypothetical protein
MLKIRPEQLEVLRRARIAEFARHLASIIRAQRPDLDRAQLAELAERSQRRARELGAFEPADIEAFTELFARYGLDLGDTPETAWAAPILRDVHASGHEKVERLRRQEPA